ncbi:MAG: allantoicase [Gammaproteobacteria bacterium]|nr:allantoicase [Gammaproteobacteria bacterium]
MNESSHFDRLIRGCINLADERLGAAVLFATDEFFGKKERLLRAEEPQSRPGVYDDNGKWMDGWETRRRRDGGHDHCVIRLAGPGIISVIEIDTRFFTGNYPPCASVQACRTSAVPDESTQWSELLAPTTLAGNQQCHLEVPSTGTWTHLKLNMYPDGGIARFRAYGRLSLEWQATPATEVIDLAAALSGGMAIACSDEHFGSMQNLLLPGRAASMAQGWETRRRREPGYEWVIVRLGHVGRIERVEIDTCFFRGNFPQQVSLNAALGPVDGGQDLVAACQFWPSLLEPQYLQADRVHVFEDQLRDLRAVSHVRINIHPDGGLSRVRLLGRPQLT